MDIPAVQENGFSDFIWATGDGQPGITSDPRFRGYIFSSDIPFTQFLIPEPLPGGDNEFKIIFDDSGQSYTLHAGVPFVFTDYHAEGASAFYVTGFESSELLQLNHPFPYEHGFRFASEGFSSVSQGTIAMGDYNLNGVIDQYDRAYWQEDFGRDGTLQSDGNNDGVVDGGDYVLWRKAWSLPSMGSASAMPTSVPEPPSVALAVNVLLSLSHLRRSRHCG
jgi:hypothetical protein